MALVLFFWAQFFFLDNFGYPNYLLFFACFHVLSYSSKRDSSRYNGLGHLERPEKDSQRNCLSDYVFGFSTRGLKAIKKIKARKNLVFHFSSNYFRTSINLMEHTSRYNWPILLFVSDICFL